MTGNIWIDQQAGFAEIEAAIFAAARWLTSYPTYLPWVTQ
jgi:hypothetical protein